MQFSQKMIMLNEKNHENGHNIKKTEEHTLKISMVKTT